AFATLPEAADFSYFFMLRSYNGCTGFLLFDRSINYHLHFRELKRFILRIFKKTADVFENAQLYSEVKRKSLQNNLLLEVGKKISSSLNVNEVLNKIIDSVKRLVSYDAAGIFLVDKQNNRLRRMATQGYDPHVLDKLALKLNVGIYGRVIQTKQTSNITDVSRDSSYYAVRKSTRSQLTVPLLDGEEVIGIMALESDKLNHYTPYDIELLMTFAGQAVIAIENAQLYEESLQKKRLESELVVASKVQQALLPERPPGIPGLQISSLNIPSLIVGGDFFDVVKLDDQTLGVAIGDVSGKGAPAAILMAMLFAGFKSLLKSIYPVVEVVARLNNLLTETTAQGYFATFFFGIIDPVKKTMTYTNAGHNPPILLRKDKSVLRLEKGGIVLGFLSDQEYIQETVALESGDYLICFTDGITEVKDRRGQELGDKGLIKLLKNNYHKKPAELQQVILHHIREFNGQEDLADDVTLLLTYIE
ncbi:MAG: GAF domain-containing SpoIIE family protein phosphatase, partial [Calditrichia bacterium]